MARFKKMQVERKVGKVLYDDDIVNHIVSLTVDELPFVELNSKTLKNSKNSAVTVFMDKKCVDVDIVVKIHYSQRVSETVFTIQEAVRHAVETTTDYKIQSVNVIVLGVLFDEDLSIKPKKSKTESSKKIRRTSKKSDKNVSDSVDVNHNGSVDSNLVNSIEGDKTNEKSC